MKKVFLASIIAATALNAATDEEILSLYSNAPADIKIEIADRKAVEGLDGVEAVVIKMSQGEVSQEDVAFTKGNLFIPEIIDIKNGVDFKDSIKKERVFAKLAKVYKTESAENIIKLGNDPKKETLVIFTDAECPFCRREMAIIDNRLKENNIEIVMTSVHGDSGNAKSYLIYQETKKAKTDAEKIKILQKYYAQDLTLKPNEVSVVNIKKMQDLATKYQNAGITGVPFIAEKSKIVK